jgi:hypothetical protein
MKCYCCTKEFTSYEILAKHILANEDGKHNHQGALTWARRYNVGLRNSPRPKEIKPIRPDNGRCRLCGKPREECYC